MPTLSPQTISGLVVIPTVDDDGSVWRVHIAIIVGASRTGPGSPPIEVVNREDLVVELIGPEGSFEPIASPDPGPLPVAALRAAQAQAEYTFGHGAGQPDRLEVNLRGESATFLLNDTMGEPQGFRAVPKKGDDFPIPPDTDNILVLIFRAILRGLRRIKRLIKELLRKPKCCVTNFGAPLRRNPGPKREFFEMEADFSATPKPCRCTCCEYRQFVRGAFRDAAGQIVPFPLPSGPLDTEEYQEDGVIDEFEGGVDGFYGHRDQPGTPGDEYINNGCSYRANDTPGCLPTQTLHAEFLGLIVDLCRGTVVDVRTWNVDIA